jgi:hypothetical protein
MDVTAYISLSIKSWWTFDGIFLAGSHDALWLSDCRKDHPVANSEKEYFCTSLLSPGPPPMIDQYFKYLCLPKSVEKRRKLWKGSVYTKK